jgi:naphthalene 1,2-dioxygenase system ferredoxin subunit
MSTIRWVRAAVRADLIQDDVVAAMVEGREVALYCIGDEVLATDNICTHGHARLSEGFLMDDCVECPLHQGQFNVRTGHPVCEPVTEPIRTYPVRVAGDDVEVGLSD